MNETSEFTTVPKSIKSFAARPTINVHTRSLNLSVLKFKILFFNDYIENVANQLPDSNGTGNGVAHIGVLIVNVINLSMVQ